MMSSILSLCILLNPKFPSFFFGLKYNIPYILLNYILFFPSPTRAPFFIHIHIIINNEKHHNLTTKISIHQFITYKIFFSILACILIPTFLYFPNPNIFFLPFLFPLSLPPSPLKQSTPPLLCVRMRVFFAWTKNGKQKSTKHRNGLMDGLDNFCACIKKKIIF